MRKLLQRILYKPVLWASEKFSSRPRKDKIYSALTNLFNEILNGDKSKGLVMKINPNERFIVFSDHHKGGGDGADDFLLASENYYAALEFYYSDGYQLINLGDAEELWENTMSQVKRAHAKSFELEKRFAEQGKFFKVYGNHDLFWVNDPLSWWQIRELYDRDLEIYEGLILRTSVGGKNFHLFLTHGHQGDSASDGNWFSKFFVARVWGPLQSYLRINPNTPAYDEYLKTEHNHLMYEWSASQDDLYLVTGHTHQPVFASLTHLERLYKYRKMAELENDNSRLMELKNEIRKRERITPSVSIDYLKMKSTYFNSGCCCYRDGDITGLEISSHQIRLVKWNARGRQVLEEMKIGAD